MMKDTIQPEYSSLAKVYDTVMKDVNYENWADFIDEIIQVHHPHPHKVLELACGTGSLSFALNHYDCYEIIGTDKSADMIQRAREKAHHTGRSITFKQMDFLDVDLNETFDIIVCIFDSINYLHSSNDILRLFDEIKSLMYENSLFLFDFTTPRNSMEAINFLNNKEGITPDNYHFYRKSKYDAKQQIHYNTFEIKKLTEDHQTVMEHYTEEHSQRIYSLTQMQDIIGESDFDIVAKYSEFDLDDADDDSLRITMVLRCLNTLL